MGTSSIVGQPRKRLSYPTGAGELADGLINFKIPRYEPSAHEGEAFMSELELGEEGRAVWHSIRASSLSYTSPQK